MKARENRIKAEELREILQLERAGFYRQIKEYITPFGVLPQLLDKTKEMHGGIEITYFSLHQHYLPIDNLSKHTQFVLECYSRLGGILPEEMQKKLPKTIDPRNIKEVPKKIKAKFCNLNPIQGKPLDNAQKKKLSLAVKAIFEEKEVTLTYTGADKVQLKFSFRPFTLCVYREDLYLLGHMLKGGEWIYKTCKVRRIDEISLTDITFPYPRNWSPQEDFQHQSGIIVRSQEVFDVQVRVYAESRLAFQDKKFFNSRLLDTTADYDLYELTCTAINEFVGQLFVYAQDIEIVNNEKVRQEFIKKAESTLRRNKLS